MNFKDSKLNVIIKKNLEIIKYNEMTKIQEQAIPLAFENKNIIGLAQTGTGKTAAFLLPIIHKILEEKQKNHKPVALIIAPTRDLIYQIFENFINYAKNTKISAVCIYGGVGYDKQIQQIKKGVDIVFANTGRLMDLSFKKKILDLSMIKYLVLDEADQMLDMGFSKDIIKIVDVLNNRKQTFLFSATMPNEIKELINKIFIGNKYETINAIDKTNINDVIKQEVYLINGKKRNSVLVDILKQNLLNKQAIIFCRTKKETRNVYELLKDLGYKVDSLHSDRSQSSRTKALKNFKNYEIDILVATNIAARGIDVNNLEIVINYNLPDDDETFIHRIGRTGRKGNIGTAYTLISPRELYRINKIENMIKTKIKVIRLEKYLSKNLDDKIDNFHGYKNIKGNKKTKCSNNKFKKNQNKYKAWEFKPRKSNR